MKLLNLIHFFLVFLFFSPLSAQAPNYRFSHIVTEHILDKADIQSLHQDQSGFVWIGSFDGFIQYDGVKSKAFKRRFSDSNSLNHNIIYGITETPDALWAVAWGGDGTINRLDKQTHHVKRIPLGQRNSAFDNVISLKNGNFAIGGSNALTFFNPKTYESKESESARSLSTIELPNGIVVSGITNKLMIYHPKQGLNYTLETLNTGYQTSALCIDTLGAVWLGTHRGLKRYYFDENNHKEQVIERLPDALKTVAITALCISFDGALWIGTATQGLYRWHQKDNTLLHFEANDKLGMLTSNTINVLMEDNNHLLWIGTPQGLNVTDLTPSVFQHIYLPRKNALDHNSAFSVTEDKNGLLWIGADALYFYDPTIKAYKSITYPINSVTTITKTAQGDMWIGSLMQGAFKFKVTDNNDRPFELLEHLTVEKYPQLLSNSVIQIYKDDKGNTWFGTYTNGISVRDANNKWHNGLKEKSERTSISHILQTKDKTMWLGAFDGLAHALSLDFDNPQFEYYTTQNGLSYSTTCDILEDKNGNIWVATVGGGVNCINPKTKSIKIYTEEDGLPSNSIVGILEDDAGLIWMSTFNGLVRLNPVNHQITVYKTKDGLESNNFKFFSKYKDKSGKLYFGSNIGLISFDPKELTERHIKMPIYLTDIKLFNQSVTSSVSGSILTKSISSTDALTIPYDKGVLTFEFASLFYKNPDQLQYAYQLVGFDKDWNYIGNNRTATYTYLPPNHYTFKVKATANGTTWVEMEKPILLIIKPLWYQTVWFRLCLIALLLLGIYKLYQYQRKRLIEKEHAKTREKELEQAQAIKKAYNDLEVTHKELKSTQTQLIQKEKLASLGELTAGIAHEIQNPLNFVNNFSELSVDLAKDLNDEIHKPDIDKGYVEELLTDLTSNQDKINHHGKRASSIVKGMLEHSRTSTGERAMTDINALADEYLRLSYHGLRAKNPSFNADYKTDFQIPLSKISIVPQDMGRVLLNLYNNAFYAVHQRHLQEPNHTPSVIVSTKQLDNQIIITVQDNGMGMSEGVKAKIFQPFFTTKPTGEGTGLGLSLAYDIVTKGHGGTLEVVSTEGVGSEFIIKLPI